MELVRDDFLEKLDVEHEKVKELETALRTVEAEVEDMDVGLSSLRKVIRVKAIIEDFGVDRMNAFCDKFNNLKKG